MIYYIYKLYSPLCPLFYIGRTVDRVRRLDQHRHHTSMSKCGKAVQKYGPNTFAMEILEEFENKEDSVVAELKWIKKFGYDNLLNTSSDCGVRSFKHSEATKEKISLANTGKRHSVEAKKKIAEAASRAQLRGCYKINGKHIIDCRLELYPHIKCTKPAMKGFVYEMFNKGAKLEQIHSFLLAYKAHWNNVRYYFNLYTFE